MSQKAQEPRSCEFFCRSCGMALPMGQIRCGCGKDVVTGLPWSTCVVLGILLALVAYPGMITLWLAALKKVVAEFIPRAALALVVSTAILGPVFAATFPLARAARVLVGPPGAGGSFRAKLRILDDAWIAAKQPEVFDVLDGIDESCRVPFLEAIPPQARLPVFLGLAVKIDWAAVASGETRGTSARVGTAALNALVKIGDQDLITDLETALSREMSGDQLEIARAALANQRRRIERRDAPTR